MTSRQLRALASLSTIWLLAGCIVIPEQVRGDNWVGPVQSTKETSFYPARALRLKKTGKVVLSCVAEQGGRLQDCRVRFEYPKGLGFGDAALKMYGSIVIPMSQVEIAEANAGEDHDRVSIPVSFTLGRKSCVQVREDWQALGVTLTGHASC
jgi:hypothetical protein